MQISKRNFLKPESSDPAIIENISENFEIIENLMDGSLGAIWGGYIENDFDTIEKEKIYVDKRDYKQWLGISSGEFSKATKIPFSLSDKADKTIEIVAGNGLIGGGDLRENRTLNIVSANTGIVINPDNLELKPPTASTIGGVKEGEGVAISLIDGVIALKPPTATTLGGIKAGNGVAINPNDGVIELKPPTSATIGGVKAGNGIIINPNDGVIQGTVPVGGLIFLTQDTNPAELFWGTSWEKIEGKYLKGTSANEQSGIVGGNKDITLDVKNIPSHSHTASQSSHGHTQPKHRHEIPGEWYASWEIDNYNSRSNYGWDKSDWDNYVFMAREAGGDNTGLVQPPITVGRTGDGVAFNAEPPFYTIHIWKRII